MLLDEQLQGIQAGLHVCIMNMFGLTDTTGLEAHKRCKQSRFISSLSEVKIVCDHLKMGRGGPNSYNVKRHKTYTSKSENGLRLTSQPRIYYTRSLLMVRMSFMSHASVAKD